MAQQSENSLDTAHLDYEYIIVGAGPAGVQMAYFLQTAGRSYIVYEANESAASFFETKPRHRKLISINKKNNYFEEDEFNLRHDWNSLLSSDKEMRFTKYSDDLYPNASDLHHYLNDFVHHFDLNIQYNTKVNKVSKQEGIFTVSTESGLSKTCRCLLMASGTVEENLPSCIEGLELADTYGTHEICKEKYKNKMVLIIGGGNSAFETGNYLSDTAAIVHILMGKRIQFAWNTHYVGDLRAVNNDILDMYHLKSMHSTFGGQVIKLRKSENGKLVATIRDLNTHWETPGWLYFDIEYDYVISCMGWKYVKPELFDHTIKIETCKNGRYPLLSSCWETETENLFFIGTNMAGQDRKAASGFIHGFRYNIRTLHHILENRFYAKPLPSIQLPPKDLLGISDRILGNLCTTFPFI